MTYHRKLPATAEAAQRSGHSRGQRGLTDQEWQYREDKRRTTRDYYCAIELHAEDQAAKGWNIYDRAASSKGKGKKRYHKGKGAAEHSRRPRRVENMWTGEQWLVYNYRTGSQQFLCLL